MEFYGDYHTHTVYSHGKGSVADNAARAAQLGLKQLAITDHGFHHMLYNMRRSELPKMRAEIEAAKQQYGIDIFLGVEGNLIGADGSTDITEADFQCLDIILCGFHKVVFSMRPQDWLFSLKNNAHAISGNWSKRAIERNTDTWLRAVEKHDIDILTHINYSMKLDVVRVAQQCADYGTMLELNGKRINFSDEEFLGMLETGVKIIATSDAHSPAAVGNFALAAALLGRTGVDFSRLENFGGEPRFRSRLKKGLYKA